MKAKTSPIGMPPSERSPTASGKDARGDITIWARRPPQLAGESRKIRGIRVLSKILPVLTDACRWKGQGSGVTGGIYNARVPESVEIPAAGDVTLQVAGKDVRLTNLNKVFWQDERITKGRLIQYYADVAPYLLPHIRDRAMVMKRYPHGAAGEFFFMKRAPSPRPDWIRTCRIDHGSKGVIDFPVIDDLPSLLWVINLGCIDLNQWYARCDDVNRPDYVHFDLDPGNG